MSDLEVVRRLAGASAAALEASRRRIDDLNVYPVPDGDTGTNLTLTVSAVADALDRVGDADRKRLADEITRAALLGARGNSGVILSQIVRGFAEVAGASATIDSPALARAFRSASDAAYRALRDPVEGTMLTVARELAEEAETRAAPELPVGQLLRALVRRGEEALARTPEQLEVLRDAGVVDAGGAGLLELLRGLTAAVTGEELPPVPAEAIGVDAVHLGRSRYRYCTSFVVEGEGLDAADVEARLDCIGDSLIVVGDERALKVHVHTDDPGRALSLGVERGTLAGVEIADMHRQTEEREARLLAAVGESRATDVVAVVAGDGNARLFRSLGAARIVESTSPSAGEMLVAIEAVAAREVIVLPNNPNAIPAAEQAAGQARRSVRVVPTRSIPAGLAALVVYDGSRPAAENADEMEEALAAVATGAITVASRDAALDGLVLRKGAFLGLLEGEPVAGGERFDEVAAAVVERLLAGSRSVLTVLTGEDAPPLNGFLDRLAERHPNVEVDVREGGQPHYHLLLSAE
ncbi:MAG TPA: DAK2 domain-containing protein [Gaiellaceae bacterium]|nr:DAK2 domain-containing protein [Gaiellaceae bacterium]